VSQSDSFVEEVTEELRRDRLFAFFRRWGPYVIAVLVLIVAFSAWNEYRKARALAEREARGDALRAALAIEDPAARLSALDKLVAAEDSPSAVLRLARAVGMAAAGDTDGAVAALKALAGDDAVDVVYRDAAKLRLLALDAAMSAEDRIAMLDGMIGPDAPYRLLALEARAVIVLGQGEKDKAIADLRTILTDPAAAPSLQARAFELFRAAGGDLAALLNPE